MAQQRRGVVAVLLLLASSATPSGERDGRWGDAALAQLKAELRAELLAELRSATANPPNASSTTHHGVFVVTDFGADPTGVADSTLAIQAALDAATYASFQEQTSDKKGVDGVGGILEPEVRFPGGRYRVSRTLDLVGLSDADAAVVSAHCASFGRNGSWCTHGHLQLRGDGKATLEMENATADVMVGTHLTRLTASGLRLVGGRHQMHVGNNNTDQGAIRIHDCSFERSNGVAIHILGPSCAGCLAGVGNCPDGPTCSREEDPFPQVGSFSTQVTIRDCVFVGCDQVLVAWSDWVSFSDSWISTSLMMRNKAVIENHDRLFVENIVGVPASYSLPWNVTRGRWIDNYAHRVDGGMVHVRNSRFGGEGVTRSCSMS